MTHQNSSHKSLSNCSQAFNTFPFPSTCSERDRQAPLQSEWEEFIAWLSPLQFKKLGTCCQETLHLHWIAPLWKLALELTHAGRAETDRISDVHNHRDCSWPLYLQSFPFNMGFLTDSSLIMDARGFIDSCLQNDTSPTHRAGTAQRCTAPDTSHSKAVLSCHLSQVTCKQENSAEMRSRKSWLGTKGLALEGKKPKKNIDPFVVQNYEEPATSHLQ